jgi:hypothetical protein
MVIYFIGGLYDLNVINHFEYTQSKVIVASTTASSTIVNVIDEECKEESVEATKETLEDITCNTNTTTCIRPMFRNTFVMPEAAVEWETGVRKKR